MTFPSFVILSGFSPKDPRIPYFDSDVMDSSPHKGAQSDGGGTATLGLFASLRVTKKGAQSDEEGDSE